MVARLSVRCDKPKATAYKERGDDVTSSPFSLRGGVENLGSLGNLESLGMVFP